jgi:hypothetical protein
MWRQASTSATDYAVFSSIGGFSAGQQLAQTTSTTTGSSNKFTLNGTFTSPQPTTSAVEFRLYGWNAAASTDSTHVTAASMRARFASVAGVPIDPTGSITVQGDFYHLDGGILDIDIGGTAAGLNYDQVVVNGKVEIEGELEVSLVDSFIPALGDTFHILTATQGILGQFDDTDGLPSLANNLVWRVDYLTSAVRLTVISAADFNRDGDVDAADYVLWRNNDGTAEKLNLWRAHFGTTINPLPGAYSDSSLDLVPEPSTAVLFLVSFAIGGPRVRRLGGAVVN